MLFRSVVANLERSVRLLLAFCDLAFDPRCLKFHETARPVATASGQQVRRPIYRDTVQRARAYDAYLAPLRKALG